MNSSEFRHMPDSHFNCEPSSAPARDFGSFNPMVLSQDTCTGIFTQNLSPNPSFTGNISCRNTLPPIGNRKTADTHCCPCSFCVNYGAVPDCVRMIVLVTECVSHVATGCWRREQAGRLEALSQLQHMCAPALTATVFSLRLDCVRLFRSLAGGRAGALRSHTLAGPNPGHMVLGRTNHPTM